MDREEEDGEGEEVGAFFLHERTSEDRPGGGRASAGTFYVLCGTAFSGKTTLARALGRCFGCAVVSADEINALRGLHGGEGVADEEWARTHRMVIDGLADLMRGGAPHVAVDDTACFRFLRDDYRRLAAEHGYEVHLLVLRPPAEELERRRQAAAASGGRRGIDEDVFAEHVASFEWPGGDEEPIPVPVDLDAGADLERWLAEALGDGTSTDRQEME